MVGPVSPLVRASSWAPYESAIAMGVALTRSPVGVTVSAERWTWASHLMSFDGQAR